MSYVLVSWFPNESDYSIVHSTNESEVMSTFTEVLLKSILHHMKSGARKVEIYHVNDEDIENIKYVLECEGYKLKNLTFGLVLYGDYGDKGYTDVLAICEVEK